MSAAPPQIVLASGNPGKLQEFSTMLAPVGVGLLSLTDFGLSPTEEPFGTFVENALAKARHASSATGLPALADDSGLCVDALGGLPGVRSARWAALAGAGEGDTANNARLVEELDALGLRADADAGLARAFRAGARGYPAHYYCVLVMLRTPSDPQPLIADAIWRGEFIRRPRGEGGFGYDPHFLVAGQVLTAAELDPARKNALSHRGAALRDLVARLQRLSGPVA